MYFALLIQIEAMVSKYQEASYFNIIKLLTRESRLGVYIQHIAESSSRSVAVSLKKNPDRRPVSYRPVHVLKNAINGAK